VLVLGVTADDKGAQLESLLCRLLEEQGYLNVRLNVVGAGGNEIDVTAERQAPVLGGIQTTPLMCEAKAYAGPVNMPTWHRFLGKLLIARADDSNTVGLLIALNGVNGNVAGSLTALKRQNTALLVFEGTDLVKHAINQREASDEQTVRAKAHAQFRRTPVREEAAYYGGALYWIVSWNDDRYSVVDGHGDMLPTEDVTRLRPALEATLGGALLATDEARADAEARHYARLAVTNLLFRGQDVRICADDGQSDAAAALADEPFTAVADGALRLLPPADLDAAAVARLFLSLFDNPVKVPLLSFMADRHHQPYVERLVDSLPDLQAGFTLDPDEHQTLLALAVPFPSVWAAIATQNSMITTHRTAAVRAPDDAVLAADRVSFWEVVFDAVRSDYSNPRLRGFLYDHMDIAELEEREQLLVKTKTGPLGQPVRVDKRNAVRQYSDQSVGEAGAVHVMVRLLLTVGQPWDDMHPEPAYPLDEQT